MGGAAKLRAGGAWSYGRIPVLDIGPYLAGDAGAAVPLARTFEVAQQNTEMVRDGSMLQGWKTRYDSAARGIERPPLGSVG